MAINCGAEEVYTIADSFFHEYLRSLGAIPLNPENWVELIENNIDLVIDSVQAEYHKQYLASKALKIEGKYVCVGTPITTEGLKSSPCTFEPFIGDICAQLNLLCMSQKKATFYDLFSTFFHYPEIMKVIYCLTLIPIFLITSNIFVLFLFSK